ncbi:MAG: chemotaxis protein CheV [Gammaproteobacteria bacterium]|nr:chemotaxis protein CheV [Gammaproteobacteria bacterium]
MPAKGNRDSTNSVLQANKVAGTRLELLLFRTSDDQLFGINVFKVQEIIPYQRLTGVPGMHPLVRGVAHLRGRNMPVIDLATAIGKPSFADITRTNIIITEHNRSVHGFLVGKVDRIVHTQWDQVRPPPKGSGRHTYVTSVTVIDNAMIAILDVERVYDEVAHTNTKVSDALSASANATGKRVLVVDDSSVARNQIRRALEQIGVECLVANDGRQALQQLDALKQQGIDLRRHLSMIISDIEMPAMDGYQLTASLRAMPEMCDIYILLHSSISGEFNRDMVNRTGANRFIQKYHPDDLAEAVLNEIRSQR